MEQTASTPERTPYATAARELLRNTLLDAARDELASRTWAEVTMAEIARAAGVSRQTLYNEFGSRDEFAQALVLREADRFLTTVEDTVRANLDDPEKALTAAFEYFLEAAAENPLVGAVFRGGAEDLIALATTRGMPLVLHAVTRLADVIADGWPQSSRADCELLSECLVRLAISYGALSMGSIEQVAKRVAQLLGPFIERSLAVGG